MVPQSVEKTERLHIMTDSYATKGHSREFSSFTLSQMQTHVLQLAQKEQELKDNLDRLEVPEMSIQSNQTNKMLERLNEMMEETVTAAVDNNYNTAQDEDKYDKSL